MSSLDISTSSWTNNFYHSSLYSATDYFKKQFLMWTHSSPDSTVVGHKWWTYQEKTHSVLLRVKTGACKYQWATSKPIEILLLFLGIWLVFLWMLWIWHSLYITIPFPPSPLLLELFYFVYNCFIAIKENDYWHHTYSFLSLI